MVKLFIDSSSSVFTVGFRYRDDTERASFIVFFAVFGLRTKSHLLNFLLKRKFVSTTYWGKLLVF